MSPDRMKEILDFCADVPNSEPLLGTFSCSDRGLPAAPCSTRMRQLQGAQHSLSHLCTLSSAELHQQRHECRRDDVLMGYEVVHPVTGCCECEGLTLLGQVAVICLAITLPCFSCLPCCMQVRLALASVQLQPDLPLF